MQRPPLTRPREHRVIAGVCAGVAEHLGVPVNTVRVWAALLTLVGGTGGLMYVWLWATVPVTGETEPVAPLRRVFTRASDAASASASASASAASVPASGAGAGIAPGTGTAPGAASSPARRPSRWPIAELLLAACLLIAGGGLVLERLGVRINLALILPGLAVLVGVGLTWWQVADRGRPERRQLPRVLAALVLVAVGVLMFFVTAREPSVWTVIAAALAVLAGVAFALAPLVLRLNRELLAERAGRAREAERSEIAAHLHDSVLQTLALIQQRSEPGSEIARIARAQERELREWLFRGADGAGAEGEQQLEAADTVLRAHAADLEAQHAVRFDVVVVGAGSRGEGGVAAPEVIIAAAREAMLNAARHAGGDVTVYIEVTTERLAIDVTDRGPGLDPEALPEGRMGVRESILGRMRHGGGTARIVPGPGGGTSVRLAIPLTQDPPDSSATATEQDPSAQHPKEHA